MTRYHIRLKKETFPEPTSEKFDPDFSCWTLATHKGGETGHLMDVVESLFEYTKVSDYYSKLQVIDVCLKYGYFGYSNWAIYYLPQSNKCSLDLMEEK
jgi:hypothetical protein